MNNNYGTISWDTSQLDEVYMNLKTQSQELESVIRKIGECSEALKPSWQTQRSAKFFENMNSFMMKNNVLIQELNSLQNILQKRIQILNSFDE